MKTQAKKITLFTLLALAIAAAGLYVVQRYYANKSSTDNDLNAQTIDYNPPTQEQIDAGLDIKEQTTDDSPPEVKDDFEVVVSASNQNDPNYQVRVLIPSVLDQDASCTLTMTQNTRTVSKQSAIQLLASSSTCKGFDIPLSELNSGEWTMKIAVTSGARTGSVQEKVQIQ